MKHWHLLHINPNIVEIFQNPPIQSSENDKLKRKFTKKLQGKYTPCLVNNRTLSCQQIANATCKRNQTNKIFQTYHNLNCNSTYVIYMLECTKCKIQCVGKAEIEFNIRFNNHQKDVWKPDAIPASSHFSGKNHNFNTHAKFLLIEQICHIDIDKEENKGRLKQKVNFWILTLETLTPKGLNQQLN